MIDKNNIKPYYNKLDYSKPLCPICNDELKVNYNFGSPVCYTCSCGNWISNYTGNNFEIIS